MKKSHAHKKATLKERLASREKMRRNRNRKKKKPLKKNNHKKRVQQKKKPLHHKQNQPAAVITPPVAAITPPDIPTDNQLAPLQPNTTQRPQPPITDGDSSEQDDAMEETIVLQVDKPQRNQPDIFRFPIIGWDYRWQRPQQMAVQFADDGHRVFYFSHDIFVVGADATYEEVKRKTAVKELRSNVWLVHLCAHQKLNVYLSVIRDPLDKQFLLWSIQALKEQFNIRYSLSIADLPFWTPLVLTLNNNKVIYDCMDEHSGFSNPSSELLAFEPILIREADMVTVSSQALYDKVAASNPHTYLIRNAGEYDYFSRPPESIHAALSGLQHPVIGFYGAIADWFDIELIAYLAERHHDWTFFLVGNNYYSAERNPCKNLANVIFAGEQPYSELTRYLYGFDVCLIPFRQNQLTLATNPVKVYEYLSSGKPVVSTRLPELEHIGEELLLLADTPMEFEAKIQQALLEAEKEKQSEERKQFAAMNTWRERYLGLKQLIHDELYPQLSIIMTTYNKWSYTKACLDSLYANTCYPNFEIIVVDNASQDETKTQLSAMQNDYLNIVLSPVNLGYAGGNNLGCKLASGGLLILLNNDTLVPPGWVYKLLRPMHRHTDIGLVGPVSNHVGNDQKLDLFAGDSVHGANLAWLDEFYQLYKYRIKYADSLGFFCVAMRKQLYEAVGPLDDGFKIGMFEDDDYCVRVKNSGSRIAIVEDAFVFHHGSSTFKALDRTVHNELFLTNREYFERKWNQEWQKPKRPDSLFLGVLEIGKVAEILRDTGMETVLILGEPSWSIPRKTWQDEALKLANGECLVFLFAETYHGQQIHGIRKAGPCLYVTSRMDILEQLHFDRVVRFDQHVFNEELMLAASRS